MAVFILRLGYLANGQRVYLRFGRQDGANFYDDIKIEYKLGRNNSEYQTITQSQYENNALNAYGAYYYWVRLSKEGMTGEQLAARLSYTNTPKPNFNPDGDYVYIECNNPSGEGFPANTVYCGLGTSSSIQQFYIWSDTEQQAAEPPSNGAVLYDLNNCEIIGDALTEITSGQNYALTIKPFENYLMQNGNINYTKKDGSTGVIDGAINDGVLTFDFIIDDLLNESVVKINASAIENENYECEIFYETSNCTLTNDDDTIANGGDVLIYITPDKYCQFETMPYFTYTDKNSNQTVKQAVDTDGLKRKYLIEINGISLQRNSVCKVVANAVAQMAFIELNLNNSIISPEPPKEYVRRDWNETEYTISANENCVFNTDVTLTYQRNGNEQRIAAVMSDDKKSAVLTIGDLMVDTGTTIFINANAITLQALDDLTNVFLITDKQIKQLSQKRYYTLTSIGAANFAAQQIDIGQYVQSLRKYYIPVKSLGNESLILGYFNTNITCDAVDDDDYMINVECGVVNVSGIYGNSIDFNNADIEIALPFIGLQGLSSAKVMNRNIEVKYQFNLSNGECIATLKDFDEDIVLYKFNGKAGIDIPFVLDHSSNGQWLEVKNNINENNLTKYFEDFYIAIRENNIVPNQFNDNTIKYCALKDNSGLVVCDDIIIDFFIDGEESDLLKSVLKNGIWI